MANIVAFAVTPALRHSPAIPSYEPLHARVRYWRNAVYLGIGYFSLTWPVAAFLRSV